MLAVDSVLLLTTLVVLLSPTGVDWAAVAEAGAPAGAGHGIDVAVDELLEEDGTDEVRSLVVAAVEVDTKLLLSWIDLAG